MRGALVAIGLLAAGPASADFYSYQEWARLSKGARATYIAGAYDMMNGFITDQTKDDLDRWDACLGRSKMTNGQLAENLFNFVSAKPELQTGSVRVALWAYFRSACK